MQPRPYWILGMIAGLQDQPLNSDLKDMFAALEKRLFTGRYRMFVKSHSPWWKVVKKTYAFKLGFLRKQNAGCLRDVKRVLICRCYRVTNQKAYFLKPRHSPTHCRYFPGGLSEGSDVQMMRNLLHLSHSTTAFRHIRLLDRRFAEDRRHSIHISLQRTTPNQSTLARSRRGSAEKWIVSFQSTRSSRL